jgi:hypothetical protein
MDHVQLYNFFARYMIDKGLHSELGDTIGIWILQRHSTDYHRGLLIGVPHQPTSHSLALIGGLTSLVAESQ